MSNSREQWLAVQHLRALAASFVVFSHAAVYVYGEGPSTVVGVGRILGGFGVSVFFVISGFIMAYSTRRQTPGLATTGGFIHKRLVRIVPMYWIATVVIIVASREWPHPFEVVQSALFIPFRNSEGVWQPVLHAGWTLNYEMFFYALFAAGLLMPRVWGRLAVAVAISLLVIVGAALKPAAAAPNSLLQFYTDGILILFLCGCGLGWLARSGAGRLPAYSAAVSMGLAVWIGIALTGLPQDVSHSGLAARLLYIALSVGVVACALLERPSPRPGPLSRALAFVGDGSYSVYLFHIVGLLVSAKVFRLVVHGAPPWAFLAAIVAMAIIIGLVMYFFIERPIGGWLRKLTFRPRPAAQSLAEAASLSIGPADSAGEPQRNFADTKG